MAVNSTSFNNYNFIAPFYDRVSKIVFGKNLEQSQRVLMAHIPERATIAIIGGGTGAILEMMPQHTLPLDIYYIELSQAMLHQARKRNAGIHHVRFINSAVEAFNELIQFDVIITPFLFDNFAAADAQRIFNHIHTLAKPTATWLFTDFHLKEKAPLQHKLLLKTMYLFFRIVASVKVQSLFPMQSIFEANGYKIQHQYSFMNGFIQSIVYTRATGTFVDKDAGLGNNR